MLFCNVIDVNEVSDGTIRSNCRWATNEQQNANQRPYRNWKLDYRTAQAIRARVNSGESRKDVAADVGISYSQITKIMLGMRWPSSVKRKKTP